MSNFRLSKRSLDTLAGVHPDLVKVVRLAIKKTSVDFMVSEGLRTVARQKKLVAAGASTTMNSRHITGHAVDLAAWVAGEVRWDWPCYLKIAEAMKAASEELDIPIRWGGTWDLLYKLGYPIKASSLHRRFPDGPHFELPSKQYPA